jgi:UDP-glucose 4-epimerase
MKYLVTGGYGFIGKHLVNELVRQGHEVVVVDLQGRFSVDFKFVFADVSKKDYYEKIKNALYGVDTVFHLAAKARVQPSIDHPIMFDKVNVSGTLVMLELSRLTRVRRFVFSSSSSLYGNTETFPTPETAPTIPLSPYGLQKLIGEQYCQLYSRIHKLETVCLRYFNVYGEGSPTEGDYCLVMGKFIQQALEGKNLTIYGDGEQRRDFTHVQDVVQANILAGLNEQVGDGECFNIGNGDNRSINQIAETFHLPIDYLEPRMEPKVTLADNNKAKSILNWKPTGDVIEWLKDHLLNIFPNEKNILKN